MYFFKWKCNFIWCRCYVLLFSVVSKDVLKCQHKKLASEFWNRICLRCWQYLVKMEVTVKIKNRKKTNYMFTVDLRLRYRTLYFWRIKKCLCITKSLKCSSLQSPSNYMVYPVIKLSLCISRKINRQTICYGSFTG